jgi:hypothetical protein
MLDSSHAADDSQMRHDLYKQSGNADTDLACAETKREVVIEMSGKYDFTVTCKVIEMMETEIKIVVNWLFDYQIMKGGLDKCNLNKLCESTT